MERQIKYGTYSAELQAADWYNIRHALEDYRDKAEQQRLPNLAADIQRTLDKLNPQITERR